MFLEILALSVAVNSVSGYPTGAPAIACENMTPQHGVPAQNTTASYHISITKGTDHTGTTVYHGKTTIIDYMVSRIISWNAKYRLECRRYITTASWFQCIWREKIAKCWKGFLFRHEKSEMKHLAVSNTQSAFLISLIPKRENMQIDMWCFNRILWSQWNVISYNAMDIGVCAERFLVTMCILEFAFALKHTFTCMRWNERW